MGSEAPLNDSSYEPEHPPVDGKIPDVVARFGKHTQLRWFKRFLGEFTEPEDLSQYYVTSEHHKDTCCMSCISEFENDYGVILEGWCCCRDERIQK